MDDMNLIREILHSQESEKVEAFIQWIDSFIDEVVVTVPYQPFNKNTEEYKQILAVHNSARKLINSLSECRESPSAKRLSHYLQSNNLDNELHQVLRVYSATTYALNHQERTSTGGGISLLSAIEKSKLRYLKHLFKRFFPELSVSFNSENNLINRVGCHILGRESLSNRTDSAIKLKTLMD